jgi:hypothetical protein
MPDKLRLERIIRAHLANHDDDSRGLYPQPEVMPDFTVAHILPPTEGLNEDLTIETPLLLLLRVGDVDSAEFDLYYRGYDSASEDQLVAGDRRVQLAALLRYESEEGTFVWLLRRIRDFNPAHPPAEWKDRAILAAYETANQTECDIQLLTRLPETGIAPPFCAALCANPLPKFRLLCRLICA